MKSEFSYKDQKTALENILRDIDNSDSFDEKERLFKEGVKLLDKLEKHLNAQYDVITKIEKD